MVASAVLAAITRVLAADAIEVRTLHFATGAASTAVKGSLKSDKIIDYKLRAGVGQTMTVHLKTGDAANRPLAVGSDLLIV